VAGRELVASDLGDLVEREFHQVSAGNATRTLSFCASGLISEIVAGNVSRQASITVTD
jgi:hypothetical protein